MDRTYINVFQDTDCIWDMLIEKRCFSTDESLSGRRYTILPHPVYLANQARHFAAGSLCGRTPLLVTCSVTSQPQTRTAAGWGRSTTASGGSGQRGSTWIASQANSASDSARLCRVSTMRARRGGSAAGYSDDSVVKIVVTVICDCGFRRDVDFPLAVKNVQLKSVFG